MWSSIWGIASFVTIAHAAGIADIGLVFPRANETYKSTDDFPIVFTVQNASLTEHIKAIWWFHVYNMTADSTEDSELIHDHSFLLDWEGSSKTELQLRWDYFNPGNATKLRIVWEPSWIECNGTGSDVEGVRNRVPDFVVDFEISDDGQEVDLIAATAGGGEDCPNEGVALNVIDGSREATDQFGESLRCTVMGSSASTESSNPCRVKIDEDTLESMKAQDLVDKCKKTSAPECPGEDEEDHAMSRYTVAGMLAYTAIPVAVAALSLI